MPKGKDQDTRPAQSRYSLKSKAGIEASHPHVPPVSWCGKCCPVQAIDDPVVKSAEAMGYRVIVVTV